MIEEVKLGAPEWESKLTAALPLFGHRNWIVVADCGLSRAIQARHRDRRRRRRSDSMSSTQVLDAIAASSHVRANSLPRLASLLLSPRSDAPGVHEYRKQLESALHGAQVRHSCRTSRSFTNSISPPQVFRILIIKTEMTIPYTSVFFELDCGYWSAEAEERLRAAIQAQQRPNQITRAGDTIEYANTGAVRT